MLYSHEIIWGIEILSPGITRGKPVTLYFIDDMKHHKLYGVSRRKIKGFGKEKKSEPKVEIIDGEKYLTPYKPYNNI